MSSPSSPGDRVAEPGVPTGRAITVLAVVIASMWPTLSSFHAVWTSYTYSHGYLVGALAAWILWKNRRGLVPVRHGNVGAALVVLGVLSLLWWVGIVLNLRVVHQALLPLMVVVAATALAGTRGLHAALPASALFFFAVPFWEVLMPVLQGMTVFMAGAGVRLLGIEAEISGAYIAVQSGIFEVAGSCAGLNFFIVASFLGATYSYLFLNGWKAHVTVTVLAAVAAVVANWIRVLGLIVIGHASEMTHPLVTESHHVYGWIIFAVAMGLFVALVEWRQGASARSAGESDQGVAHRAEGARPTAPTVRRLAVVTGAFVAGPALYFAVGALPVEGSEARITELRSLSSQGVWILLPDAERAVDWSPELQGDPLVISHVWTDGDRKVQHDVVHYPEQRQGAELIGGGTRIAAPEQVLGERTTWFRAFGRSVKETVVAGPESPVLVWSWYRVAGVETVSPGWAKVLELWGFLRRRTAAELEAISVTCEVGQCEDAARTLRSFLEG